MTHAISTLSALCKNFIKILQIYCEHQIDEITLKARLNAVCLGSACYGMSLYCVWPDIVMGLVCNGPSLL